VLSEDVQAAPVRAVDPKQVVSGFVDRDGRALIASHRAAELAQEILAFA
jgi:hypothetical protein